jgi:hypothetical protein
MITDAQIMLAKAAMSNWLNSIQRPLSKRDHDKLQAVQEALEHMLGRVTEFKELVR